MHTYVHTHIHTYVRTYIYNNKYAREAYRGYQRYRGSGSSERSERTGSSGLLRTTFRGSPTYLRGLPRRFRSTWQIGAGSGFGAVGFDECLGWFAYRGDEFGGCLGWLAHRPYTLLRDMRSLYGLPVAGRAVHAEAGRWRMKPWHYERLIAVAAQLAGHRPGTACHIDTLRYEFM